MKVFLTVLACSLLAACATQNHTGSSMIVVRQSAKAPDELTDAVKSYALSQKWAFLGANKVKNGEVTLLKVCIPAVGAVVWAAGLEYSALLPCGNLAVYQKDGHTEISMLDPHYMSMTVPRAETARAADMAQPLLTQMLDTVTK